MKLKGLLIVLLYKCLVVASGKCYWNDHCHYNLYASKTPYDAVRGDIRDHEIVQGCSATTIWLMSRHGNRHPGASDIEVIKSILHLTDEIIRNNENGSGTLCAQDIDLFKNWQWNTTIETSESHLTSTGYDELYNLGRRLKEKYPHLVSGDPDLFYSRPSNEQRTVVSAKAFLHGLTEGTGLKLEADAPMVVDDVARPYKNCERYDEVVKNNSTGDAQLRLFENTKEHMQVLKSVQSRLNISHQLTAEELFAIYDLCRYYRSWSDKGLSPWCAAFTSEDLEVLEYKDDVRHYYKNGYGSWINPLIGGLPLKDLYKTLTSSVQGNQMKFVSYFTHDTLMEMVYSALGLYLDPENIVGDKINSSRLWRSSYISSFATNFIAVSNECQNPEKHFRVQLYVNEKPTPLCPETGCTWDEFEKLFGKFASVERDNFCEI